MTDEPQPIHVIGANGRSGSALCRALLAHGTTYVPIVRNPGRWAATRLPGAPRLADLDSPALNQALPQALEDAKTIVSCAHARHTSKILAAAPTATRFIFLGSTRKFTRWPDPHGNGVIEGERAFIASNRPGLFLHPTMIYGAQGEDNVQRLATLLRRLPLIPLPDGGRALVQPIHQSDLTKCILAALAHPWTTPETMVAAGPEPVPYATFVRAIARAAGLPPPRIVPIPPAVLLLAAPLTRLPGLPRIHPEEIRRLLEDKAFDIAPMRATLRVNPLPLAEGLALTFRKHDPCP